MVQTPAKGKAGPHKTAVQQINNVMGDYHEKTHDFCKPFCLWR